MKRFKPTTQRDIANVLGLSVSTVSRALNDFYGISAETKKLVLDYINEIEYYPNPMALKLRDCRSYSIGVIVSEIANSYFSQIINGIESVAYKKGYNVFVTQSHECFQQENTNIKQLISHSVDGILVSISSETTDFSGFNSLKEKGIPVVFFDRAPRDIYAHKIIVDNFEGAYKATEHLIKQGFHKIAHITNSSDLLIEEERIEGYKAALSNYNINYNPEYVFYCQRRKNIREEVEAIVNQLLHLDNRPNAIFSASDKLSTEILIALKKRNITISKDMAFVGFTNMAEADIFECPLTTISQPALEIGEAAAKLLIGQIESKSTISLYKTKIFETELTIRESSLKCSKSEFVSESLNR